MLVTRPVRLAGYLLLTLSLLAAPFVPFERVVWAIESTAVLSSSSAHRLWGNDKQLPATPTVWKEVDLAYERLFPYDHSRQPHPPAGCVVLPAISHKIYKQGTGITTRPAILMLRCQERIELLRPVRWVRGRLRAQNRQGYLLLSIPEMGVMDVQVHMVAVRSSTFNPANIDMKSAPSLPVIGIFIRHTTNVRQYTFKDTLTGKIDRIKATPNHPFYVVNQQRYIPVSRLSSHDQLVNVLEHPVTLVCPKGKTSHCGQPYHPGQVITIYNLEVYGQHRYFVGESSILVHNGYTCDYEGCGKSFHNQSNLDAHKRIHTGEKPFGCVECGKRFNHSSNFRQHVKTHWGEKPFECKFCDVTFLRKHVYQRHLRSRGHVESARAYFRSPITQLLKQEIVRFCDDATPGNIRDYFDFSKKPHTLPVKTVIIPVDTASDTEQASGM